MATISGLAFTQPCTAQFESLSQRATGRGKCASSVAFGDITKLKRASSCKSVKTGKSVNRTVKRDLSVQAQLVQDAGIAAAADLEKALQSESATGVADGKRPLKILVAGGGIGGLVFALAAKKKGLDVTVFERDLTAVRGEGQYRGPIQIQSNALAALEAVDVNVAEEIMRTGCVTGDRVNGLVDGLTGEWYIKFDTYTPAVERGLPVTRVISRMTLQQILAKAVGDEIIRNGATVRSKLLGPTEAVYSDYTCYTGIADFVPADIETLFGGWCDGVVDLILATPEDAVLRRDIYDRIPIMNWGRGRVTLLGDSAHAMQPNMGQGGCMAIEDGYQLALDLEKALDAAEKRGPVDLPAVLKRYEGERRMRVGAVHGLARMAAIMATTYKAYLGEGLGDFGKARIPHPGKVGGRFVIKYSMPLMLQWVLGGNDQALEGRAPYCRLEDKAQDSLPKWLEDDDALERATIANWYLLPAGDRMLEGLETTSGKQLLALCCDEGGCTVVGSEECEEVEGTSAIVIAPQVAGKHAKIECTGGAFYLSALETTAGTWLRRVDGHRSKVEVGSKARLHPGDTIEFGPNEEAHFRVKLRKSLEQETSVQNSTSAA
eukprot:jgi/Mesen1/5085/ME000252S04196